MIKVYRYGMLAPTENADVVREQMRLAHRLRNTLTEIECGRRTAMRTLASSDEVISTLSRAVADFDAECVRLTREISAKNAEARSRSKSDTAKLRADLKAARETKSATIRKLAEVRRETKPARKALEDVINAHASELAKNARAHSDVAWGTKQLADLAVEKAREDTPMDWSDVDPRDPRFSRWDGSAALRVQLQGGMTVPMALTCHDTQLRLSLGAHRGTGRRSHQRFGELRMRVQSDKNREPVWATWPVLVDRPLPEYGIIKTCDVHVRRIGPREEWYACLTVHSVSDDRAESKPTEGVLAIDVGWRLMAKDGARELRVASMVDDSDHVSELRLSERVLSGLSKPDGLRATRDAHFNNAILGTSWWLYGAASDAIPEWLTTAARTVGQWRSEARLAALVRRWREARFAGDEDIYGALETWRYRDYHLWSWETSQREGSLRNRRDVYRCFAKNLANTYEHVVLERFDLRKMLQHADPAHEDSKKQENAQARLDQRLACVSELRGCIANAFACSVGKGGKVTPNGARGFARNGTARFVILDGAYTTQTCADCGHADAWDAASTIFHTCSSCGAVWDQDENAARNLLGRWRERPDDASGAGVARTDENSSADTQIREGRWAKRKREKATKSTIEVAARKSSGNAAE